MDKEQVLNFLKQIANQADENGQVTFTPRAHRIFVQAINFVESEFMGGKKPANKTEKAEKKTAKKRTPAKKDSKK